MRTVSKIKQAVALMIGLILLSLAAHASENRYFVKMPQGKPMSGPEAKKSKKPFYVCGGVKAGPKGNWNSIASSKAVILQDVPQSEDAAEDGTRAVRCTLKLYDRTKHKTTNADLGDEA